MQIDAIYVLLIVIVALIVGHYFGKKQFKPLMTVEEQIRSHLDQGQLLLKASKGNDYDIVQLSEFMKKAGLRLAAHLEEKHSIEERQRQYLWDQGCLLKKLEVSFSKPDQINFR